MLKLKTLLTILAWTVIAGGLWILGMTLVDVSNGYVVLPSRFFGDTRVAPDKDLAIYWGMLAVWVLGGLFLIWLGWKLIRAEVREV